MKLNDLFEEQHIGAVMKELSREFKALANKFNLTMVHGMGWPAVVKDGAWIGGGLGPLRGISDEEAMLSIEKRREGFLRAVAKRLEQFIADGRTVKIGRGSSRSLHNELAVAGKVEQQLHDNLINDTPPGARSGRMPTVIWFISAPAGVVTTNFANIQASVFMPPGDHGLGYQGYGSYNTFKLPDDPAFEKKLTRFFTQVVKGQESGYGETYKPETPEFHAFAVDMLQHMMKVGLPVRKPERGVPFERVAEEGRARVSFSKQRVLGKGATAFDIETILPVLRKHGFKDTA